MYAFVNCRTESGQVVYIYKRDVNGLWQHSQTLAHLPNPIAIPLEGLLVYLENYFLIGSTSDNAAYIYKRNEIGIWEYKQSLISSKPSYNDFGGNLSISGETAIICSNGDSATGRRAYVFKLSPLGIWEEKQLFCKQTEGTEIILLLQLVFQMIMELLQILEIM